MNNKCVRWFRQPLVVALLTAAVTIPLSTIGTALIEARKSAEAMAAARRTEHRDALKLSWSAAEQFALAAEYVRANAGLLSLARRMPENPVAKLFLEQDQVRSAAAHSKLMAAKAELAQQRLILTDEEISQVTTFIEAAERLRQQTDPHSGNAEFRLMSEMRARAKAALTQ